MKGKVNQWINAIKCVITGYVLLVVLNGIGVTIIRIKPYATEIGFNSSKY